MPSFTAIETAAEIAAPAAKELAATAGANLREFAGSLFAREGQSPDWLLKQRRYVRPSGDRDALEARSPEIDWQMRQSELSEAIARRIMQPRLTERQFFQPLEEFSQSDRPLARKLLERSAGSSTEAGLMRAIGSVAEQLKPLSPRSAQDLRLFAASPSSPGNMFAYLYRKAQHGRSTLHLDYQGSELTKATMSGASAPVVIFDDLKHLSTPDRAALLDLGTRRDVFAVDVNAFERTVNFFDFAQGQDAVATKLEGLLRQTRDVLKKEPALEPEQAIEQVINDGFNQSLADVNKQRSLGSKPIMSVRSEPVAWPQAFDQAVNPDQISRFLERQFKHSSSARIAVAELLAEEVEFHSLGGMIPKLKDLQEALRVSAQFRLVDAEEDIFVVASENSGYASSDAFMTYMYKQATGLADDRIVTFRQLQALQKAGKLADRRVVALDDAIYNGWQAELKLGDELASFPHVALGTLSSFNKFAKGWHGFPLHDHGVRDLVHLQTDFGMGIALDGSVNSSYAAMTEHDRELLGAFDPAKVNASLKVFPHMASDTAPYWLRLFVTEFPITFEHLVPN